MPYLLFSDKEFSKPWYPDAIDHFVLVFIEWRPLSDLIETLVKRHFGLSFFFSFCLWSAAPKIDVYLDLHEKLNYRLWKIAYCNLSTIKFDPPSFPLDFRLGNNSFIAGRRSVPTTFEGDVRFDEFALLEGIRILTILT